MNYGYCRISTPKQNIDRQERSIRNAYPQVTIVKEIYSGTTTSRPQWEKVMRRVKKGDTIIFESVSRMSRNADDGYATYEELFNRGVELVFLKEPYINTATYRTALARSVPMTEDTKVNFILEGVNKYLIALAKEQIYLAFDQAEKEVEDLRQRTREGMETARLNGRIPGPRKGSKMTTKKEIASKAIILKHAKTFGGSLPDTDVMKLAGITKKTYYKYKKELRESETPNISPARSL